MSTASHRAYEEIRRRIFAGDYPAGVRLREDELSAAIGVSRTPIREALRRLDAEGIVVNVPNRGAHVASWTDAELNDIFEIRALLESYAARRAATRLTAAELDRLDELSDEMDAYLDKLPSDEHYARITRLNTEFHQLIMESAGSPLLGSLATSTIQIPLMHRTFRRYSRRALERSFDHHRELVEACRARDAVWAESIMRSHILSARHIFDSPATDAGQLEATGAGLRVVSTPVPGGTTPVPAPAQDTRIGTRPKPARGTPTGQQQAAEQAAAEQNVYTPVKYTYGMP
jgi:DNA-binding GntR family transcriptional regulator